METIVCAFKLASGEEIIGKVVVGEFENNNADEIISSKSVIYLKDARALIMLPSGDLRLAPVIFAMNKENEVRIKVSSIAAYSSDIEPKFLDAYNQATSSIVLPKKEILMG